MSVLSAISGASLVQPTPTAPVSATTSESAATKAETSIRDTVTLSAEARAAKASGQPLFAVEGAEAATAEAAAKKVGNGSVGAEETAKAAKKGGGGSPSAQAEAKIKASMGRTKEQTAGQLDRIDGQLSDATDRIEGRLGREATRKTATRDKLRQRTGIQEEATKSRTKERLSSLAEREKAGLPVPADLADTMLSKLSAERKRKSVRVRRLDDRMASQESATKQTGKDQLSGQTSTIEDRASDTAARGELKVGRIERQMKQVRPATKTSLG